MAAAAHMDASGGAQQRLHQLNVRIAQGDSNGLEGLAACIFPFLSAIDWRGDAREIAEALPHAAVEIDLVDFRNAMSCLGLTPRLARTSLAAAAADFSPCVFLPEGSDPLVVMAVDGDRAWVFDSAVDGYRDISLSGAEGRLSGTAIFLPRKEEADTESVAPGSWLFEVAFRFRKLVAIALALTFGMTLLSLIAPLGIMALYIAVLPYDAASMIPYITAAVLACLLAEVGLRRLRAGLQAYIAGRVDYLVSTGAFEQVIRMPAMMTTTATVGDQAARLRAFQAVRDLVASPMAAVILELPFLPIYVLTIWIIAGPVAFVPVVALLVYMAIGQLLLKGLKRKTDLAGRMRSDRHAFLVEMLRQMQAIKQLGAEEIWAARFRAISGRAATASFDAARANFALQDLSHVVMVMSGVATMSLAVYLAIIGEVHSGALIAVMALTWRVLSPIQSGLKFISSLEKVWLTARQLNALMRIPIESRGEASNLERRIAHGVIRCHNVSLRFGRNTQAALLGVNFEIAQGEFAVIVGRSGSGKSTLAKVMLRLQEPQSGALFIDEIDIRQVAPPELRRSIGYAPQYPKLLYGTLTQNLRLYQPAATMAELEEVCDRIGILEVIQRMPEGFETRFGDQMTGQLPTGFLNCLSVAAAMLRRPAVLLLDEAHDGLDEELEGRLLKCIESLRGHTTIVMVTHRPSHMRLADRVLMLEEGRLIENGKPEDVMPSILDKLAISDKKKAS